MLLAKFDPKSGVAFQRLDDLSSGWHAELVIDSGLEHIAEPGTVGGGSTSAWMEHVVDLTSDPAFEETISLETADGGFVTWQSSGDESAQERKAKEDASVHELGQQLREAPPPLTTRRMVALIDGLFAEHNSMLDHFEDLINALKGAFESADLSTSSQGNQKQDFKSVRVPLTDSEDEIRRMRRSLKEYVRSSLD